MHTYHKTDSNIYLNLKRTYDAPSQILKGVPDGCLKRHPLTSIVVPQLSSYCSSFLVVTDLWNALTLTITNNMKQ